MLKKAIILAGVACLFCCRAHPPEFQPPAGPSHRSVRIKFQFRSDEARQGGRVLWRLDEHGSKFLFFSPLNQAGLELDVAGEAAVLVNFSKGSFWQGAFSELLDRMWGIDLDLAELKALLLDGSAPPGEFAARGIAVTLERKPGIAVPVSVRLKRGNADLSLNIQKDEFHAGRIVLVDYAGRYREASLEDVLKDD